MAKVTLQFFLLNAFLVLQPMAGLNHYFNTFNKKVYGAIARDNPNSNILISPLSINIALGLLYLGAENRTARDLRYALQLKKFSKLEIAKDYAELISTINNMNNNKDIVLKMANQIFVSDSLPLAPNFTELSIKYFETVAENLDFNKTSSVVKYINTLVEQETTNIFRDLLQPNDINENTMVLLTNAIYFKANWSIKFDKRETSKQLFYVNEHETIYVDFMQNLEDEFAFAEFEDWNIKVLELPYESTNLSMIIVLPNEIDGLADFENVLERLDLISIFDNLIIVPINIKIPKFHIDFGVNLKRPLEKSGLRTIFTKNANLSELVVSEKYVSISKIIHKAFINVDEGGSKVAASKAFIGKQLIKDIDPIYEFKADHPFLFAITDKEEVLFAGHVVRPQEKTFVENIVY